MATNFGTKVDYNSAPVKNNCALFLLTPRIFGPGRAIRWCHLNFALADPCCHGNKFWDKIDYNSAPAKDNCTLFSPTPDFRARTMQWYHVDFSPTDPCCHSNQPLLFKDKIGCSTACIKMSQTLLHHT